MNLEAIRQNVRHWGIKRTLYDLVYRAINRVACFRILTGVTISLLDPAFLACDDRYRCQFLEPEQLQVFSRDSANEMPREFLDDALRKGDECFAILDGKQLASYGWYARTPTAIDPPDLRLHFGAQYVYMYKGFTHSKYRGQRLHAVGMTKALESYLARGHSGLVSYVEANNFASLKSVYRMGYSRFGDIVLMKLAGRYKARASRGCEAYRFRVEPTSPDSAPGDLPVKA